MKSCGFGIGPEQPFILRAGSNAVPLRHTNACLEMRPRTNGFPENNFY
jgi:hypothetical protein